MLILSGCGSGKKTDSRADNEVSPEKADQREVVIEITGSGSRDESDPNARPESEEAPEPEETPEPEILHFVDVFGEEYEVEINDNIAKTPYDNAAFERNGDRLSYEDDVFSSEWGIDVSRYQNTINWEKVKAAGAEFAFIRIGFRGYGTEGSLNLDDRFKRNIEEAKKAGIDVGVYFFAQAVNEEEAREEAEFVIKNLEGYELDLPVVYDPESILDAEARTDNVTGEQFTKNTEVFCSVIKEAGYSPMIYCNMLWEAYELDLEKLSEYPVWYADYEYYPQTPYLYEYWQYSNEGRIDGISGGIDLNIRMVRKP
ncbi:MAG: glycoside hydrolase family 25 protein [Lachnospiraceae bacterium]|nr:glycoside hydrolase family 25 protein [Lachnospiraceae bacterium]